MYLQFKMGKHSKERCLYHSDVQHNIMSLVSALRNYTGIVYLDPESEGFDRRSHFLEIQTARANLIHSLQGMMLLLDKNRDDAPSCYMADPCTIDSDGLHWLF